MTKTLGNKAAVELTADKKKPQAKPHLVVDTDVRRNRPKKKGPARRRPQLPVSASSGPLMYNKSKGRKNKRPGPKDLLKAKSQWWISLKDPLHGGAAKIPDDVGIQTGTLQSVTQFRFTAAGATDPLGGIQVVSPYPGISAASPSGQNFQYMDTLTSGSAAINWGALAPFATNLPLHEYSQGVRVVSYGLYVESEASLASSSGEMVLFLEPWGYSADGAPYDQYTNLYGTSIMPLNKNQAMSVTWFPCNEENCEYTAFYKTDVTTGTPPPIDRGIDHQKPWGLGCIVSGCPAGTAFRGMIVVNYEFIPHENAIDLLSAAPSRQDVVEEEFVVAQAASEPASRPVTAESMGSSPSVAPPTSNDPDFGFFGDIVKIIATGAEVAAELI